MSGTMMQAPPSTIMGVDPWESPSGKYVIIKEGVGTHGRGAVVTIEELLPSPIQLSDHPKLMARLLYRIKSVRFASEWECNFDTITLPGTDNIASKSLEQGLSVMQKEINALKSENASLSHEITILRKQASPGVALSEKQTVEYRTKIAEQEKAINMLREESLAVNAKSVNQQKTIDELSAKIASLETKRK